MRRVRLSSPCPLVAFLVGLTVASCSGGVHRGTQSDLHSDSGINGSSYEAIVATLGAFAGQHPDLIQAVTYGTTGDGRQMTLFKIQDKTVQPAGKRPAVLISEAIHGNEYLNIADRLPRELIEGSANTSGFRQLLAKGGVVYVVPVANPDGYARNQRENAAAVDLNRDYTIQAARNSGFTQPETRAITSYIAGEASAQNLSLEASMEYHCCFGALIQPWNYDPTRALDGDLLTRAQEVGAQVKQLFGYNAGNVRDALGAGYENGAVGGSDDYYLETYGRRAFSFEGTQGSEYKNLAAHVQMWDFILQRSVQGYADGSKVVPTSRPVDTSDLYLALEAGPQDGTLLLAGGAPGSTDGLDLCLGSQTACAVGGGAQHLAVSFTGVVNDRRLYRTQAPVPVQGGTLVTITATTGGQATALRTVQLLAQ